MDAPNNFDGSSEQYTNRPTGHQQNEGAAPAWALELLQQVQSQAQRMERIEQQLAMPTAANTMPTTTVTPPSHNSKGDDNSMPHAEHATNEQDKEPPRRRDRLPDTPEFDGKKADFQSWVAQVYAKLVVDRAHDPEDVRFWYIHSRLRGKALQQVNPWVTVVRGTAAMNPDGLISQLKLAYEDPQLAERAANKLPTVKQGARTFAAHLADFEKTVLEAGGAAWDDTVKKTFLANSLSEELRGALVATPTPATYSEYCSLLHSVSQNLEALRGRQQRSRTNRPREHQNNLSTWQNHDKMEWEHVPTVAVSAAQPKRAKWVSIEEIQRRRQSGSCLRCGKKGHFVNNCPELPAQRPGQVAQVAQPAIEEVDSNDESEKE